MKNRLDLTRFPRRANADSTCRARVSNAHCTRRTAKSHADPTRSNTQARKMRLSWGFVARSRLLCENGCSPQGCETRAIGAAGAQVPYKDKVGGSNPSSPTIGYEKGRLAFRRPFFVAVSNVDKQTNVSGETFATERHGRAPTPMAQRESRFGRAGGGPHSCGAMGTSGFGRRRHADARCARTRIGTGAPAGPQARPAPKSQASESQNRAPASDHGRDSTKPDDEAPAPLLLFLFGA